MRPLRKNEIDPTPSPCLIDLDCNGSVGVTDLLELFSDWGRCASLPTDLDNDGSVSTNDLLILFANCEPCP